VSPANSPSHLVVVDDAGSTTVPGRCVAHWFLRDPGAGLESIPALVDAHADELRTAYVAWTHDVGSAVVDGRSIRAHLQFWPDFSFWWMGLIPEKAPLRTRAIYAVFKLGALERLYKERDCEGIVYVGRDRALARTLRQWCKTLGHSYRHIAAGRRRAPPRRLSRRLPDPIQAVGYLLLKCWTRYRHHAGSKPKRTPVVRDQATVITFFPNIDLERTEGGRFWSRYWEQLHGVLDSLPVVVNWVWLYVDSEQASYRQAIRLRNTCNRTGPDKYRHILVDEFMTARALARAVATFARSCLAAVRLRGIRAAFHMKGSSLNFYPILASDWRASLCGVAAMDGALTLELFDEAARQLGPSVWTLFVWENQPWEHAAVVAWRRWRNGRMFGVQHATLPPLDLRAFIDRRDITGPIPEQLPIPDLIAVNGQGSRSLLREAGFPEERLVATEALRYRHLGEARRPRQRSVSTLLVLTGFRASETRRQLKLLDEAARHGALASYRRVIVKPHPVCAVEPLLGELRATFPHEIVKEALAVVWDEADVVFAANSTSAVAEALCFGLPTAVCAPDDELNLSPAFGVEGVPMVATAEALEAFLQAPSSAQWPSDYLTLDNGLSRWRTLLGSHA